MPSKLEQLRQMTTVFADTGDIDVIAQLKPIDCTTNPSLLLKAASKSGLKRVVDEAVEWGRTQGDPDEAVVSTVADRLAVSVGFELTKLIPGRVSTEVDANLSFSTEKTVQKARAIIQDYAERGISERILKSTRRQMAGGIIWRQFISRCRGRWQQRPDHPHR